MSPQHLRTENGVLYFRCWYATYDPELYRDVAVSALEAEQALAADARFLPDASIEERAKYLAHEKFIALNEVDFGHPLPTSQEVRAKLAMRDAPKVGEG